MTKKRKIVQSLFDTDFYKFTMLQFIWMFFKNAIVTFKFKNRTNIPLAKYVDANELHEELERIRSLRLSKEEVGKLANNQHVGHLFTQGFLNWLPNLQLPEIEVKVNGDQFDIQSKGRWSEVMLWETFIMNVVSRLYFEARMQEGDLSEDQVKESGLRKLLHNISLFKKSPLLVFVDFGTRRRWSFQWQRTVLMKLIEKVPNQLAGTSNVHLSLEFGLKPIGTLAHELDMGLQGIFMEQDSDHGYMYSHEQLKEKWFELYGEELSIALSDTYGSTYFLRHFSPQAQAWKGTRHDSGCPFTYGERMIDYYEILEIDPKTKALVFSDGLNVPLMIRLFQKFTGRILVGFGIGTNLTNDMGLEFLSEEYGVLKALSIVCKLVFSNGHFAVKLSDNPAKATGPKRPVERIMKLTGYNPEDHTFTKTLV